MSLVVSNANFHSNTAGYKSFYYGWAEDTVNTCHLIVRCDATMQGPVNINGNLNVNGNITGTVIVVPDYTVTYKTADFTIPATLANTFTVYQVDTTAGPITVTLPAISALDANKKRQIDIVDVGGALSIHPLIVNTVGTDTIAGDTSVEVVVDYSALHLVSNADVAPAPPTGKWLIS